MQLPKVIVAMFHRENMDTIKSNQFTYGFELEGVFKNILVNELAVARGFEIELKGDGSVRSSSLPYKDVAEYDTGETNTNDDDDEQEIMEIATEINVGVFDNFTAFMDTLAKFEDEKNYFQNDSCGLHVHIKPKTMYPHFRGMIFDKDFIAKIQNYARLNLCEHVQDRIANNTYCKPWGNFSDMLLNYKRRQKYSFMGNHHSGTVEFRFFSPCEHKLKNVYKFFRYFFGELNKMDLSIKKGFFLDVSDVKSIEIKHNFSVLKNFRDSIKVNKSNKEIKDTIKICA